MRGEGEGGRGAEGEGEGQRARDTETGGQTDGAASGRGDRKTSFKGPTAGPDLTIAARIYVTIFKGPPNIAAICALLLTVAPIYNYHKRKGSRRKGAGWGPTCVLGSFVRVASVSAAKKVSI